MSIARIGLFFFFFINSQKYVRFDLFKQKTGKENEEIKLNMSRCLIDPNHLTDTLAHMGE